MNCKVEGSLLDLMNKPLDEAEKMAMDDPKRLTHEEFFGKLRKQK